MSGAEQLRHSDASGSCPVLRDVGVVQVLETFAGVGVGQEEVPQAPLSGLGLCSFQKFQLPFAVTPAVFPPLTQSVVLLGDGIHFSRDELLHVFQKRLGLVGHGEVVHLAAEVISVNWVGCHCPIVTLSLQATQFGGYPWPMDVRDAVYQRKSVRAFTDQAVPEDVIGELLADASRAPSGGNVQPWRIYVIRAETMAEFLGFMEGRDFEQPEYEIYPPKLKEPYRTSRFQLGEDMYATLNIARDDKPARLARMAENFKFFGAPVGLFCFTDRVMGPPQWSDLGMFLQTFMLLAEERGMATCAQEAWSAFPNSVSEFVGAPPEEMLFCGLALGYADLSHPVNTLQSKRTPVETWAKFL